MEDPDLGMVLQHVFQLHAQNDIVAEQQYLRMGIPIVQPLRPGDEKEGLAGTGDPYMIRWPYTNFEPRLPFRKIFGSWVIRRSKKEISPSHGAFPVIPLLPHV